MDIWLAQTPIDGLREDTMSVHELFETRTAQGIQSPMLKAAQQDAERTGRFHEVGD